MANKKGRYYSLDWEWDETNKAQNYQWKIHWRNGGANWQKER